MVCTVLQQPTVAKDLQECSACCPQLVLCDILKTLLKAVLVDREAKGRRCLTDLMPIATGLNRSDQQLRVRQAEVSSECGAPVLLILSVS